MDKINKQSFYDSLNGKKEISQREIIYYSLNSEELFQGFNKDDYSNKDIDIILGNLIEYIPYSKPIIDMFFKRIFSYPESKNTNLFTIFKNYYSREAKKYEKNIDFILDGTFESLILEEYSTSILKFNKLGDKFKRITELEENIKKTELESEKIRQEIEKEGKKSIDNINKSLEKINKILELHRENNKLKKELSIKIRGGR